MTLQQLKYAVTVADMKSINKAAEELFITQPSLSSTIKELEKELGFALFLRSNRGISITVEGEEFLSYARQMLNHYNLIEERFILNGKIRRKFSVSMQHYTFAVEAFMKVAESFSMDEFEFAVHETKTSEVIDNVKVQKSELGVIYLNDFNREYLRKALRDSDLEFVPLFDCNIYVYMSKNNPLAKKKKISFEDLQEYPCLSFEQGDKGSFYFAEEVFSTYSYKKLIKADDRATMLNLMVGLDGYTLCSGIICKELNGDEYRAIKLDTKDTMTIGYIKHIDMPLSEIGEKYVEELAKYKNMIMN